MSPTRAIFQVIITSLLVAGCVARPLSTAVWNPAKTTHTIGPASHLIQLREMPFYTVMPGFGNQCAAKDGLLFIKGSDQPQGNAKLMAVDQAGHTRWTHEVGLAFTRSDTTVFVADGQTVTALSPATGDAHWSTSLLQARQISQLFYFGDKLFVGATGYPFFVLSPDGGEVLAKYSTVEGFRRDYPNVPFYPDLDFQPLVIGEDAIIQLGDIAYSLLRANISTSAQTWETADDVISSAALIHDMLFYVSSDDKLKTIDVSTGELLHEASIQPSIEFFNLARNAQHDGYYLCSDEDNGILYVILGDSRQLFALGVTE